MICPFCDSQIEDGLNTCPHCNAKLRELPKEAEAELTAPETAEAREVPEAQESPEPREDQAAPEPQETAAEAQVLPEPLWSPEPEAEAPEAAPTLPEPEPEPVAVRKRSPKRGLLIGLGCAALALVVGLGIWFLGRRGSPAAKLQKAAKNSLQALEDYAHRLPNLGTMLDNLKALETSQTFHEELQLEEDFRLNGEEGESLAFRLALDADKAAGLAGGEFSVAGLGLDFGLKLYGDKTQLQLGSESMLEDQVLALPLENLPQRWNESALGKLSGLTLPTEATDPQKYTLEGLNQAFTERYGQDWTVFRESLRVAEYEGSPHFTQGVSYTLLWDQKALDAIHVKTAEVLKTLEEIESPEQLLKQDMRVLAGDLVLEAFWQFSNECKDLQLLVEKELLTGFYMAEKEGSGFLELRLQGEENPWTHCTAAQRLDQESSVVTELLDLTMTAAEGQLRITAKSSMLDSEGKEYEAEESPVTLVYRDSDGNVSLEGVELGDDMEMIIRVTPVDAGAALNWELKQQMEFFEGYNLENSTRINAQVTGTIASLPAPLSQNPTDLLGLSQAELEALVEKIGNSLMTLGSLTAASGRSPIRWSVATADRDLRVMASSSVQYREGKESVPENGLLTLTYLDSDGSVSLERTGLEALVAKIVNNCMDLVILASQP